MFKHWFFIVIMALGLGLTDLQAHPWKPDHFVVVDTDGGIDDMRAITLLLASPSVRVLAIIASHGEIDAEKTCLKVRSLLEQYHHQGVLVGVNSSGACNVTVENAEVFHWGDSVFSAPEIFPDALSVLNTVVANTTDKITFISLGSLNTYATFMQRFPENKTRFNAGLWLFNESIDKDSLVAETLISEGLLNVLKIEVPILFYSDAMISQLSEISNVYAKNYVRSQFGTDSKSLRVFGSEWTVLFLNNAQMQPSEQNEMGTAIILDILKGKISNPNQVFASFPNNADQYINDVALKMDTTISKYGLEEWSACVITNELHRHVGIYALVGAKMGIRAREYFDCGADEMKITTFVGSQPPMSCMNDGIQVSTGATIGHGLITISNIPEKAPKAVFSYLGNEVVVRLKPEYQEKLVIEVKQLAQIYGINSNIYWDLVREIALNCWFNWDRNHIFTIEPQKN